MSNATGTQVLANNYKIYQSANKYYEAQIEYKRFHTCECCRCCRSSICSYITYNILLMLVPIGIISCTVVDAVRYWKHIEGKTTEEALTLISACGNYIEIGFTLINVIIPKILSFIKEKTTKTEINTDSSQLSNINDIPVLSKNAKDKEEGVVKIRNKLEVYLPDDENTIAPSEVEKTIQEIDIKTNTIQCIMNADAYKLDLDVKSNCNKCCCFSLFQSKRSSAFFILLANIFAGASAILGTKELESKTSQVLTNWQFGLNIASGICFIFGFINRMCLKPEYDESIMQKLKENYETIHSKQNRSDNESSQEPSASPGT